MVRKLVLSLIAVMGVCAVAFAQNKQVSGRIVDTDGVPVIGATVMVEGTTVGTASDADGKFSISAPANGTLNVSYISYETQIIPLNGRTHIDVTLKPDSQAIETVAVIGYGSGSKVGGNVGSVVKVKGEQLANKPTANIADALQGKVAGLQVYSSSGEPTEVSSMRLHGAGSLTAGTSPLLVIDGVPASMEMLVTINSNDIESVNMLKDASATSIYGSRAANGVLYVTLKKGRRNEQATVVVNAQYGVSEPILANFDVMNTEELANYEFSRGLIPADLRDERINSGINTDWSKFYYRHNAPTFQADISIAGGSESTSYYISGGYMKQSGTAPGSELSKYSFRTSVESVIAPWMRVGSSVTMGYDERSSADANRGSLGNAALMAVLNRPDSSPYDEDGNEVNQVDGNFTPKYISATTPRMARKFQLNANAFVQITPVKGLNIKSLVGVDALWFPQKVAQLASFAGSPNNGMVLRQFEDSASTSITNTIDYNFDFTNTDHALYLLAGQEGVKSSATSFNASRYGQPNDDMMMLSNGIGVPAVSDSYSSYLFNSWFGRAEYSYQGKYTVDATVRRDASSRFGAARRSAVFYSFGAMWNIKKENFLLDNKTISDLALKVSYGTQGNASIPGYASKYQIGMTTYNDQPGLYLYQYGNPDLGWETQKLFTVAANIGLWKRLTLEFEFYNRVTEDMLMNVPQPATSGYASRYENVGSMRNRGIDLTLEANIVQTKDWQVNFNATFGYGRSIVTRLFNGYNQYVIPNTGICYEVGKDASSFYLPIFVGIDPADGLQMWEKIDANGVKGTTKNFGEATHQLLDKTQQPPYTGGFGFNASWKGLTLSADFAWSYGKYMFNNNRYFMESVSFAGTYNRSRKLFNEWTEDNRYTDVPKFGEEIYTDTRHLEDSSYLRMKNLTLAWELPAKWFQSTNVIRGIRVYFTGRNLFTVSGYTGFDPEVYTNMDLGGYPNSRQYVGGVQITF